MKMTADEIRRVFKKGQKHFVIVDSWGNYKDLTIFRAVRLDGEFVVKNNEYEMIISDNGRRRNTE